MIILIAGGGRTGAQLASVLLTQKHDVRLIEHRSDVLGRIHHELPTEVIYEGLATDPAVLEQAGIRQADAVAAVTTSDADNLALCFLARTQYHVPRTIARVNNPRTAWLFNEQFHVDVAVNQAAILASLFRGANPRPELLAADRAGQVLLSIATDPVPYPESGTTVNGVLLFLTAEGRVAAFSTVTPDHTVLDRIRDDAAAGWEVRWASPELDAREREKHARQSGS